jgi:hypothetical protein
MLKVALANLVQARGEPLAARHAWINGKSNRSWERWFRKEPHMHVHNSLIICCRVSLISVFQA